MIAVAVTRNKISASAGGSPVTAVVGSQPVSASAGGSSVSASVGSSTVGSSVSGSSIAAAVASSLVSAAVSGGIGPQGPAGAIGNAESITIALAGDVALSGLTDGDVLRYSSARWRNYADANLTDGGNF